MTNVDVENERFLRESAGNFLAVEISDGGQNLCVVTEIPSFAVQPAGFVYLEADLNFVSSFFYVARQARIAHGDFHASKPWSLS